MIRRYLAGIITGSVELMGRRRAEPECWWGMSDAAGSLDATHAR